MPNLSWLCHKCDWVWLRMWLAIAGQVGEYADGKLVTGGIKAEAEQIMLNIKAALARRGLGMEHVVKCMVFLADIAE